MSNTRKFIVTIVIVVAIAGALLSFTKPGHLVLINLGLTTACGSGDGC